MYHGGFVLSQDGIGLAFALAAFVLTVVVAIQANKLQFTLDNELKPKQRKRDYVSRVLYLSDYAKEIRLSNVKEKLYEDFLDANEDVTKSVDKHTKKLAFYDFIMQYVCNELIFNGLYIVYLLFMTIVKKAFTYGTMVALYNSCSSLKNCLASFSAVLPEFVQHSLYIEKIKHFLAYDVKVCSPKNALPAPNRAATLELKDVSFAYHENSAPILKHINLTIHSGEKIALVGYNGACKTTLVKLIMRLYDATEGEILYDGENIRRYDLDSYRSIWNGISGLPAIRGDFGRERCNGQPLFDRGRAEQALESGGFGERLSALEKGLDTPLTKEFEDAGTNLRAANRRRLRSAARCIRTVR
ncbi:MAG: ATP-binding cassette domain-containing protein [Oscillospiraceae bacterium]